MHEKSGKVMSSWMKYERLLSCCGPHLWNNLFGSLFKNLKKFPKFVILWLESLYCLISNNILSSEQIKFTFEIEFIIPVNSEDLICVKHGVGSGEFILEYVYIFLSYVWIEFWSRCRDWKVKHDKTSRQSDSPSRERVHELDPKEDDKD